MGTAALLPVIAMIPIAGAIVAAVALLLTFVGGGCGHACIDASLVEQIPEAAADNLYKLCQMGMISVEEAVYGMQILIQYGQQHEAALGQPHSVAGSKNLTQVINNELAAAKQLPDQITRPIDMLAARAAYIQPGTHGWYDASVAAAAQWTDSYLQGLASIPGRLTTGPAGPEASGSAASLVSGMVETLKAGAQNIEAAVKTSGLSPALVLALAALGIWAVME